MRLTWDRGTLLVHDVTTAPAFVVWDPRVGIHRAPAWRYSALVDAGATDGATATVPSPGRFSAPELRPYQAAALAAWCLAERRGIVVLPTGAGKTRTAIAAIATAGVRTLVLAPTRVLVAQWVAALEGAGVAEVGQWGDGVHDDRPIAVATFASARLQAEVLGNRFGLLVVDEAHHFEGPSDETLELYTAPLRLGLTATPSDDPTRTDRLTERLGPVVYTVGIDELAGRWLAPFEVVALTVALDPEERRAFDREAEVWRPYVRAFFQATPSATWVDFVAHATKDDTGRRAMAAWRRSRAIASFPSGKRVLLVEILAHHEDSRTLVFAPDTAAAYEVARDLLVPVITCDIGRAERARVLGAFAAGELRVLVSARVLNEGVDVPEADVAVLLGGSHGDREYLQRIGRVLRPAPGKEAVIYDLVTRGTSEVARSARRRRG